MISIRARYRLLNEGKGIQREERKEETLKKSVGKQ